MSMDKIIKLHTSTEDEAIMIKNMKAEIEREKIHQQYSRMQNERSLRESLEIDPAKDYKEGTLTAKNDKFQAIMEKKLPFINGILSQITCVAANVAYLIGARTGGGKSTTVANIVIPILKANKKILIISNEESRNHVFVRIACRMLGYSFIRWTKGELHQSVRDNINKECERLAKILTVIGTDFQNNPKFVTTPEGLEIVFNKYAGDHEVILFDYFQAISHSVSNPDPQVWVHQEKFCNFINLFKDKFDGPIFIMSQLWPAKKKDTHDFLERIKGRKAIGDVCLVHIEIAPDKENCTSAFIIHKDRLWNNDGMKVIVGYDRETGNFVNYDEAFKAKASKWIAARLAVGAVDEEDGEDKADEPVEVQEPTQTPEKTEVEDELNLDYD